MRHVYIADMNALHLHQTTDSGVLDDSEYYRITSHLTECELCRERWIFDKELGWYRDRAEVEAKVIIYGLSSIKMFPEELYNKIDGLMDAGMDVEGLMRVDMKDEWKLGVKRLFEAFQFMERHRLVPEDVYGSGR